jgi:hypothetical protein
MNIIPFYNQSGQPVRADYPQAANNPGGRVANLSITVDPVEVNSMQMALIACLREFAKRGRSIRETGGDNATA